MIFLSSSPAFEFLPCLGNTGIVSAGLRGKDLAFEYQLGSHLTGWRVLLDLAFHSSSTHVGTQVLTVLQRKAKVWYIALRKLATCWP